MHIHELKKQLAILGLLVGLLIAAQLLAFVPGGSRRGEVGVPTDTFVPVPPPPEIIEMLAKSRGFEVLVSYTNRGFEPSTAVINIGESIRFTNNSSNDLWVAATGTAEAPVYPGIGECGSSTLDTCKVLKPREFWEFTFTKGGMWMFHNNLDKGQTGVVRVDVR